MPGLIVPRGPGSEVDFRIHPRPEGCRVRWMPEYTPRYVGGFGNPPMRGGRPEGVNPAIHLAQPGSGNHCSRLRPPPTR